MRGWSGYPGARAEDPLADGQQRGELVPGGGRIPRLPGPAGEARAGRSGCPGARGRETRSSTGSSAANWSRAAAASPACPVQQARLARAVRVSGCSGPRTRSRTGSSAANWSRAAAGSPASPVQRARLLPGGQGVRVLGAEDPLARRAAARRTGRGRRPHPPPPRSSGRGWRGRPGCPGARPRRRHPPGKRRRSAGTDPGRPGSCRYGRGTARSAHMPPLVRSRAAWACGSSAAQAGQVPGSCGSSGIAASIRAAAACRHCLRQLGGHLIGGDGLDQPVHRHRPVGGRADQRIPAQRRDRVTGASGRPAAAPAPAPPPAPSRPARPGRGCSSSRSGIASGAQHASSRSSPAAPGAACSRSLERQRPGGGDRLGVPGRLAAAQQVRRAAAGTRPGTRPGCSPVAWMYAAACSSASGSPPSSPASSRAACSVRRRRCG